MTTRIQRRRTPGWSMQAASPDGRPVVYVGRPTLYGNPFTIEAAIDAGFRDGRGAAVEAFSGWLRGQDWGCPDPAGHAAFKERRLRLLEALPKLRGKHLCCFCPLNAPCHVDVLLEMANR